MLTAVRDAGPRGKLMLAGGALLALLGVFINWRTALVTHGYDFRYLFIDAKMLLLGANSYDYPTRALYCQRYGGFHDLELQPYPPSVGFVLIPLGLMSYRLAWNAWFLLMNGVLLFGLWRLLRVYAPRLGAPAVTLILGASLCMAGVRWGFASLQMAPLLTGIFAWYVAELAAERRGWAFVVGFVGLCLKPTYVLPFLGLPFMQKRFGMVFGMLGLWLALNGVGMARMGGAEALASYRYELSQGMLPTRIDAPDPHIPYTVIRLDWPYLLNAIHSDIPLNNLLGHALTAAFLLWMMAEWWRSRDSGRNPQALAAWAGPLVCLGTLMVYHHHYEAALFIPTLLLYAFGLPDLARTSAFRWYAAPILAYISVYPIQQVQALVGRHFGVGAFVVLKPVGCVVVVTALFASLAMLRSFLGRRRVPAYAVTLARTPVA